MAILARLRGKQDDQTDHADQEKNDGAAKPDHVKRGRVVILGGHGKVALLTAPKLIVAGFTVDSVIRKAEEAEDVKAVGANPVLFDMERASVADFERLLNGAVAVLFSAGAGGGNPKRTHAVDYVAAVASMDAAEQTGVQRFIMVSYDTASEDPTTAGWPKSFVPYAQAKHDADAHLRQSGLDYTILGPGTLTLEPESDRIVVVGQGHELTPKSATQEQRVTSRGNVAAVAAYVIATGAAKRETVNFYDGSLPIAEALA